MNTGRLFVRILFVAAALTVVVALVGTTSRRTVAADAKAVDGIRYGYQLESYRVRHRMYLRFWSSAGLSLEFDLPGHYPGELSEMRWLADGGAIYLRFSVVRRDPGGESAAPVKLLYDFRNGELWLSSPAPLGRLANTSAWLTDEQFEAALAKSAETRMK